ncbi:MAG: SCO family protein [Deltaproteobacteria bacterium]|nr:SCO family protein [Deltaproteobacteria bacterium]
MNTFRIVLILVAIVSTFFSHGYASLSPQEEQEALRVSNNAIGSEIGDYTLIDQDSKSFKLRELIGKPFIISLIYTNCGHICPTITMNLGNAMKEAGKDFGTKFTVVTVGFDVENDTSQRMKEYGSNFTSNFKNWRFVTADEETMKKLTKALGFYYKKRGAHPVDGAGGFDHLNVVTVVDARGEVYKHIYGIDFKPQEVLQPVYESMGAVARQKQLKPAGIIDRITLFCYKYDEASGTYKLNYPFLIKMTLEAITIFTIILFVWRRDIKSVFQRCISH